MAGPKTYGNPQYKYGAIGATYGALEGPSGTSTHQMSLSGSLGLSGDPLRVKVRHGAVGILTPTGSITRKQKRQLVGVLGLSGQVRRLDKKRDLVGTLTPSGSVRKRSRVNQVGVLTPTSTVTVRVRKRLVGTLTLVGSGFSRRVSVSIDKILSMSGQVRRRSRKRDLVGILTPSGSIRKKTRKKLSGSLLMTSGVSGIITLKKVFTRVRRVLDRQPFTGTKSQITDALNQDDEPG